MIEIALHERLGTIHMGLLPGEILAHLLVGIAIAMRLVVGLIHHVEPPTVAKLIEVFTVRIVGGAQEVDVGLLHQPDILLVGGIIDIAACQRMMVMAIHATQLHVLAVDLEDLADNLHLLHTKVVVEMLDDGAFLVEQFHTERIEIRLLGRPQLGLVDDLMQADCRRIANRQGLDGGLDIVTVDLQHGLQTIDGLIANITKADVGFHVSA